MAFYYADRATEWTAEEEEAYVEDMRGCLLGDG